VEVEGKALTLSNLDKVLYPAVALTKRDVLRYYTAIDRCCSRIWPAAR